MSTETGTSFTLIISCKLYFCLCFKDSATCILIVELTFKLLENLFYYLASHYHYTKNPEKD